MCTACGHEWEFEQSIKDDPLKVCEKCNQDTARRQISRGVGFILKGGGWYSDLYSSTSNKPKEGGGDKGGGDKGGGDKGGGGSDTGGSTSSGESKSGGSDTGSSTPSPSTPKSTSSVAAA
jgi:putative FmdB family regulatory protein